MYSFLPVGLFKGIFDLTMAFFFHSLKSLKEATAGDILSSLEIDLGVQTFSSLIS
jgi:hypothetical protein